MGLRFDGREVEATLLAHRTPLVVFDPGHGQTKQTLSGTLLIAHEGGFGRRSQQHQPGLVSAVRMTTFSSFLTGADKASGFDRYGVPAYMRPHAARHWLKTRANKAGMSVVQITLWIGRATEAMTLFYLHDQSDLADLNREGIKHGEIVGEIADRYRSMPVEDAALYLEGYDAAHRKADGYCLADNIAHECEKEKICELCGLATRTRADDGERSERARRRARVELAIARYEENARRGLRQHPRQMELALEMLAVLNRIEVLESTAGCHGAA